MAIMVPVEVNASPRKSLADAASELLCVCWPMRWLNQQRISIDTAEMAASHDSGLAFEWRSGVSG